jgi:beta-lactamase superfamily II metal-dependent hydrolase
VSPEVASISSDLRNSFGHPHAETLRTLQDQGVLALRLDQLGAIEWQSDGRRASFRSVATGW